MKVVIAAFNYHEKRTVLYTEAVISKDDKRGLTRAVERAIDRGAKVISIRVLVEPERGKYIIPPKDERFYATN